MVTNLMHFCFFSLCYINHYPHFSSVLLSNKCNQPHSSYPKQTIIFIIASRLCLKTSSATSVLYMLKLSSLTCAETVFYSHDYTIFPYNFLHSTQKQRKQLSVTALNRRNIGDINLFFCSPTFQLCHFPFGPFNNHPMKFY